jgi:NAD(P)-dependent dehydrogenase (short-subunit alcohol dehydrogenase family)
MTSKRKIVIITGASRGIGAALVKRFRAAGVAGVVLELGGASAVALAWELQLLATHAKTGS